MRGISEQPMVHTKIFIAIDYCELQELFVNRGSVEKNGFFNDKFSNKFGDIEKGIKTEREWW